MKHLILFLLVLTSIARSELKDMHPNYIYLQESENLIKISVIGRAVDEISKSVELPIRCGKFENTALPYLDQYCSFSINKSGEVSAIDFIPQNKASASAKFYAQNGKTSLRFYGTPGKALLNFISNGTSVLNEVISVQRISCVKKFLRIGRSSALFPTVVCNVELSE